MTQLAGVAARGTAVTVLMQVAKMLLQVGSVTVLGRLLLPETFGLVAMVTAVIGVAELLRDFGLSLASMQSRQLTDAERSNLFWVNAGLGLLCAAAAWAVTPLIVAVYDEPTLSAVVPPLAGAFVLSGMTTQFRADLARRFRFGALAVTDILGPAVGIAVAIVLAARGAEVEALVAQQLTAAAVTLVVAVVLAGWLPRWYRRDVPLGRFFRFGGHVLGAQLLDYVTRNADTVALGAVWGAAPLGVYTRGYQLAVVPINQINAPLTKVAVPVLARVADDRAALERGMRRAQLVGCYVTAPLLAVAGALAVPAVAILLGPGWDAVAPIFAVLAVGSSFRAISQIAYWGFLATSSTGALLRLQLWAQPLMVLLLLAGLPWGGVGVAVGYLVGSVGYWVASIAAFGRATRTPVRGLYATGARALVGVALPAAAAAHLVQRSVDGSVVAVLLGVAAAAATVALVALVVRPVRRDLQGLVRTALLLRRRG
ncbi:lipopolysaccharide biosynthesis protein [Cellulomonas marina]|uniref:Polysaccharide transporter, PST family n=1 Tax=Cellulomonas marina TaxID=988821 RepID=A0A1I0X5P4_9CELL|nr:lipopolysaccharide biosynthesis protein [Cellulomonas marina]GIG28932.1 lipopolysaccharide biosynthesis protein [Cellulomonas marina]SFA95706.1 polysaccharide transporter, PST family [Cellulomonas marina]